MQPRDEVSAPAPREPVVLIADDDAAIVKLIEVYVSAEGYQTRRAYDGASALEQVRAGGIDLVLLDIRMPKLDGFEVCRRIREDPANARIPVVFLTAELRDPESELLGFEAGADEYLHKPIQRRPLLARVKSLIRLADAERDRRVAAQLAQSEKFAAIGQIAAGVAHEINNPLAFILSNLNSLDEYQRDIREVLEAYRLAPDEGRAASERLRIDETLADIQELIRETVEGGNRVRAIVQQLKTYSRADDEHLEPVDLAAIAAETLVLTERELSLKAKVTRELSPAPVAQAPRARLHQVVLNLIVNAQQALAGHSERNEIRIVTGLANGLATLSVSDTGVGIPAELQPRVFEPFFTTKPVGVGSGLGLSVCANVVRKLGGQIAVFSEPGRGTTFTISLPAGAPAEPAQR